MKLIITLSLIGFVIFILLCIAIMAIWGNEIDELGED